MAEITFKSIDIIKTDKLFYDNLVVTIFGKKNVSKYIHSGMG
jgi:hypothetical protein